MIKNNTERMDHIITVAIVEPSIDDSLTIRLSACAQEILTLLSGVLVNKEDNAEQEGITHEELRLQH